MRRIAHGIKRYVLDCAKPFIVGVGGRMGQSPARAVDRPAQTITAKADSALVVPTITRIGQTGGTGSYSRSADEPVSTIVSKAEHLLVTPTLQTIGYGEREGQAPRVQDLHKPLSTIVGSKKHALVSAFLAKHYTGVVGSELPEPIGTVTSVDHHSLVSAHITKFRQGSVGTSLDDPLHTVTAGGQQARPGTGNAMGLVTSNLVKLRGTSNSAPTDEPLASVSAGGMHHAEVRAFLMKYYGSDQAPELTDPLHTITTKDRFGIVQVQGEDYVIADIGMRMLQPRELYRAQGFPDTYIIDRGADGKPLPKDAQVRLCGNSVCPPIAAALVRANYVDAGMVRKAA